MIEKVRKRAKRSKETIDDYTDEINDYLKRLDSEKDETRLSNFSELTLSLRRSKYVEKMANIISNAQFQYPIYQKPRVEDLCGNILEKDVPPINILCQRKYIIISVDGAIQSLKKIIREV